MDITSKLQEMLIKKTTINSATDNQNTKKSSKPSRMSQYQLKRQREWVYLTHFLAEFQLHPIKTISGSDDGKEPDFTCVFNSEKGDYYIGIELTTLPRLRDRLGNNNLMLKRWYWQSILQMSTKFTPTQLVNNRMMLNTSNSQNMATSKKVTTKNSPDKNLDTMYPKQSNVNSVNVGDMIQHQVARTMSWLPSAFFMDMEGDDTDFPIDSKIEQIDIDAVMAKKASKVQSYQQKRPLDETWLLIHTNEQQENGILVLDDEIELHHHSEFDRVFLTLYPSQHILQIKK